MKAIIQHDYSGINGLQIENVKIPQVSPISDLVEVKYAPVLPWDVKSENGELKKFRLQHLPSIIGYSFAGIVSNTGLLRSKKHIGQKVIGVSQKGSFAEYVVPEIPLYTFTLPENVSLKAGATIFGGADTAMMMLHNIKPNSKSKVLLIGAAGGVGSYLLQLLNLTGISTTVFSSNTSQPFLSAHFNNKIVTSPNQLKMNNYDYLLDTTGNSMLINQLETTLVTNGTIFSAALPNFIPIRKDLHAIFKNNPISPHSYQKIIEMLSKGQLVPYIDSIYDFTEIKSAQRHLSDHGKAGRTLVNFFELNIKKEIQSH